MKPCQDNNGVAIYVRRDATGTILCFNIHTTVEYLNRNVSSGQLLQQTSATILVLVLPHPDENHLQ